MLVIGLESVSRNNLECPDTLDQLKYIAANYGINFTSQTKKADLLTLILAQLGSHEEEANHHMENPSSMVSSEPALALEIERVKIWAL